MSNKIEKIVRYYVTKALTEVVKDLDQIIERKVQLKVEQRLKLVDLLSEDNKSKKQTLNEVYKKEETQKSNGSTRHKLTAEDLGITEDTWKSVYADTLSSDHPLLNEVDDPGGDYYPSAEKPEHISEGVMEELGFMKDYSKHVEAFDAMDKKKHEVSKEDLEAQAKYREALNKRQYG